MTGLSAAMFLALRGVEVLVVERHPGTSLHPRAIGQHPRTMELFRVAGITDEIRRVSRGGGGFEVRMGTTVRKVTKTLDSTTYAGPDLALASPQPLATAAQDYLEPIILNRARQLGADIRFTTEFLDFKQDANGITAHIRDRHDHDRRSTVHADYLIAADGYRSPIRTELGIRMRGPGTLTTSIAVVFEADLSGIPELVDGRSVLYYLQGGPLTGTFGTATGANRYLWGFDYDPAAGESVADYTPERVTGMIRTVLEDPSVTPEILDILPWGARAELADSYRAGRVLLAGDAVKVNPPTGGLGGYGAIGDAYDLSWKIAAVLTGQAGVGLLDTYQAERRPLAELAISTSLHHAKQRWLPDLEVAGLPEPANLIDFTLGSRVRSSAVLATDDDPSLVENPFQPTGRPGFRAPHVVLTGAGRELSTVDLFGPGWMLLSVDRTGVWAAAVKQVATELGIDLTLTGSEFTDPNGDLSDRYGIGTTGASLLRPDGVIAWRVPAAPEEPATALRTALTAVLHR
jgi:putative polyketide hydroxylase